MPYPCCCQATPECKTGCAADCSFTDTFASHTGWIYDGQYHPDSCWVGLGGGFGSDRPNVMVSGGVLQSVANAQGGYFRARVLAFTNGDIEPNPYCGPSDSETGVYNIGMDSSYTLRTAHDGGLWVLDSNQWYLTFGSNSSVTQGGATWPDSLAINTDYTVTQYIRPVDCACSWDGSAGEFSIQLDKLDINGEYYLAFASSEYGNINSLGLFSWTPTGTVNDGDFQLKNYSMDRGTAADTGVNSQLCEVSRLSYSQFDCLSSYLKSEITIEVSGFRSENCSDTNEPCNPYVRECGDLNGTYVMSKTDTPICTGWLVSDGSSCGRILSTPCNTDNGVFCASYSVAINKNINIECCAFDDYDTCETQSDPGCPSNPEIYTKLVLDVFFNGNIQCYLRWVDEGACDGDPPDDMMVYMAAAFNNPFKSNFDMVYNQYNDGSNYPGSRADFCDGNPIGCAGYTDDYWGFTINGGLFS